MPSAVQIEILKQIAQGRTNLQIARAMSYSEQAIKYHVTCIMRKLNAKSRAHAVAAAIERGLLDRNIAGGERKLIVEGLTDLRNRSDESLYAELIEQILVLKDEVARLTDQLRGNDKPAVPEFSEIPSADRSDQDHFSVGSE